MSNCKFPLPFYALATPRFTTAFGPPELPDISVQKPPFPGAKLQPIGYSLAGPSLPTFGPPDLPDVSVQKPPFPGAKLPPFGYSLATVSLPTFGAPDLPELPSRPCPLDADTS